MGFHNFCKIGFSDKKPTPGCIASAPTNCAAVMIAGIFKYDLEDELGQYKHFHLLTLHV